MGLGNIRTMGMVQEVKVFRMVCMNIRFEQFLVYSLTHNITVLHAGLVLFQATTLNVAFNSHNKALLTIMMSNNVSGLCIITVSYFKLTTMRENLKITFKNATKLILLILLPHNIHVLQFFIYTSFLYPLYSCLLKNGYYFEQIGVLKLSLWNTWYFLNLARINRTPAKITHTASMWNISVHAPLYRT